MGNKIILNLSFINKIIVLLMISLITVSTIEPIISGETNRIKIESDKKDICVKETQNNLFSNQPKEEWNKTFGGDTDDAAYYVQQTDDQGFIIGGYTKSYGIATCNPWLIKTDFVGNEQWNRTYNYYSFSNLSGYIKSVQQTIDGGYILGCSFYNFKKSIEFSPIDYTKQDYLSLMVLIKTDANGI